MHAGQRLDDDATSARTIARAPMTLRFDADRRRRRASSPPLSGTRASMKT